MSQELHITDEQLQQLMGEDIDWGQRVFSVDLMVEPEPEFTRQTLDPEDCRPPSQSQ